VINAFQVPSGKAPKAANHVQTGQIAADRSRHRLKRNMPER
jgi:hypothetical protein